MNRFDIKPDEKVCYNCRYRLWMVAIGWGVRCGYTEKKKPIPNLRHTCDHFEFKKNK